MTSRADIVAEARTWLGCPFRHQGRIKGLGVDCVGLVICVARALGLVAPDFDVQGYERVPDGFSFLDTAHRHMTPIAPDAMQPGDVVVVSFDKEPQHMGILGDYRHGGLSIIHAAGGGGNDRVIETRLLLTGAMQFKAAFALPGVQ